MLGKRLLVLGCTTLVSLLVLATPANALYVRPAKAPMLNAAGAANGCEAKATEWVIKPYHQTFKGNLRVECPASASVHRISIEHGIWEVMGDGSLREVAPYGRTWLLPSVDPMVGTFRFEVGAGSCSAATIGTPQTWLIRARISTKQSLDNSDSNPYVAKVDRLQTIVCP